MVRHEALCIIVTILFNSVILSCFDEDISNEKIPSPENVYTSNDEFASGVLVSWEKSADAESYNILRADSQFGNAAVIAQTENEFYHDQSAVAGLTYYYSVSRINNSSVSVPSIPAPGRRIGLYSPVSWTIMIYMDGDNNLDGYAEDDFNEIELGIEQALANGNSDITSKMNVILLLDLNDTGDTRLYRITNSGFSRISGDGYFDEGLTESSTTELNMADPDTLSDFIGFSLSLPATDHYALLIWDHGMGAKGVGDFDPTVKFVCEDYNPAFDVLYLDEVQNALEDHFSKSVKLDIIAFDACLMSTVEVAYEFKDLARFMVASMGLTQVYGWDYISFFNTMTGSLDESFLTPADMCFHMVNSYRDYILQNYYYSGESLAAIKLSEMDELKSSIDNLAVSLYEHENWPHVTSDDSSSEIETARDNARHYYKSRSESREFPYYNLYDLCTRFTAGNFSSDITRASQQLTSSLSNSLLWTFCDSSLLYDSLASTGAGVTAHQGLTILFSRGNLNYLEKSFYVEQTEGNYWYTSYDLWNNESYPYGSIDFCTYDNDRVVESWLELHEAWYDPLNVYTPSTY